MKKSFITIATLLLAYSPLRAEGLLKSETDTATTNIELRVGATFTKTFRYGLSLSLEEEIRMVLYDYNLTSRVPASPTTYFNRSYTTIGLDYEPIEYLQIGAGYTFKLYGQKGWNDPREFMRHRLSVAVTGQYKYNDWKFSLRERLVTDFRLDSVNLVEQPKADMQLRHRLHIGYNPKYRPYRPYLNLELINTLNQPTCPYLNEQGVPYYGGQYLSDIRTQIGFKYRINKRNTLNFYYRFDASWNNDYNITKKNKDVEIVHETTYTHIVGLFYEFDW